MVHVYGLRLRSAIAAVLFIGGAGIYLLFRSRAHLGFCLLDAIGLGAAADTLRESASRVQPSDFVLYSLPDGLWTTSYILLMDSLFCKADIRKRLLWASPIPLSGLATELLQRLHLLPGVFDWMDMLAYSLPYTIYFAILMMKHKNLKS